MKKRFHGPWGIKGREVLGGLGMKRDDIKNVCVGDSVVLQKKLISVTLLSIQENLNR